MSEVLNSRAADAAYKTFPTFREWQQGAVVDIAKWDRFTEKLESIKQSATPQLLDRAKEVVKRATAWDTGSIEGLYDTNTGVTMTIALESALWEGVMNERGEEAAALFAAQLHAYNYVLDFATRAVEIVPTWIRHLHAEICAPQKTYKALTPQGYQNLALPKGEYKALPNHVIGRDDKPHYYAPVDLTPTEVDRLCKELRSKAFLGAHPVLQASYAHYAFILIHPFADGNGRVARALASVFTYRAISVPLLILLESRPQYLSSLMEADASNYQPFVDFVMERCFDSIRLFEESVLGADAPDVDEAVAELRDLYVTRGGYTHEEIDAAGLRLFDMFFDTLKNKITLLSQQGITTGGNAYSGSGSKLAKTTSRLPLTNIKSGSIVLSTKAPAQASVSKVFSYEVPKDSGKEDELIVNDGNGNAVFEARVTELIPTVSPALQIRINMACDRLISKAVREVVDQAKDVFQQNIKS